MKKRILSFFTCIFLFICIFFPADKYNIKLYAFFLIIIIGYKALLNLLFSKRKQKFLLFMGIMYPIFLIILSLITGKNFNATIAGVYPTLLILIAVVVIEYKIEYKKYFINFLDLLSYAILLLFLLDFFRIIDINENQFIRYFFYELGAGMIGKSSSYSVYYKIFFKASPLLVISFSVHLYKKNFIKSTLVLFALLLSGTRANLFIGLLILVGFVLYNVYFKAGNNKVYLKLFVSLLLVICIPLSIKFFNLLMNTSGSISSDNVRNGQLRSFIKLFSNPKIFLFGQGFGSKFFDEGRNILTYDSEIAYLDLLRKIGFPLFLIFMIFVLMPFKSKKIPLLVKFSYFGYLLICFTNPLLFSSTAYILYIFLYVEFYKLDAVEHSYEDKIMSH